MDLDSDVDIDQSQSGCMDIQPSDTDGDHIREHRKRLHSDQRDGQSSLPPHNEDCDCSTSLDEFSGDEPPVKRKVQKSDTEIEEFGSQPVPHQESRRQHRKQFDLRPEVLLMLSPRSIHRTLMDSVDLNDISDITSSSFHSSMFDDFDAPPNSSMPPRHQEYEIASLSPSQENPNPIEDILSSTDDEEFTTQGRLERCSPSSSSSHWSAKEETERGNFADSSDSESEFESKGSSEASTDSELSEKDKWFCSQCNLKTNSPYFRYCLRCFSLRRNWLPKRPSGRNKTRPPPKVHRERLRAAYTYPPADEQEGFPRSTPEDERSTSQSSKSKSNILSISTPSACSEAGTSKRKPFAGSSNSLSLKLQSTLDAPPVSVATASGERDDPLCIICMAREKNSAFVHGKSAHFCCCFSCGDKILKRAGKCPVCRKKILRVVKIIV